LAPAGRELGLSPASVSARLVALEKHYGAALLHRTTRAISLTDEGRLLVQGARRLLRHAARRRVRQQPLEPSQRSGFHIRFPLRVGTAGLGPLPPILMICANQAPRRDRA
jgi:DNA-binding transcriptional LysR family regulator